MTKGKAAPGERTTAAEGMNSEHKEDTSGRGSAREDGQSQVSSQGSKPRVNRDWRPIIEKARELVLSAVFGVTLRALHYWLFGIKELGYENKKENYLYLKDRTADLRNRGEFPDLIDDTRELYQLPMWDSVEDFLCIDQLAFERTEGQEFCIVLGVEKRGHMPYLKEWFGPLGVPIFTTGGSCTIGQRKKVRDHIANDSRPKVLLMATDFDPKGLHIYENFVERSGVEWAATRRFALTDEQVERFGLPTDPAPDGEADSIKNRFAELYGELRQVELDSFYAKSQDEGLKQLRSLWTEALHEFWDQDAYEKVLRREDRQRRELELVPRLLSIYRNTRDPDGARLRKRLRNSARGQ